MNPESTIRIMSDYIEAINQSDFERLAEILSPEAELQSSQHTVRFGGNVIARLRAERAALPDLHLTIEQAFAAADGAHGVLLTDWTARRLKSQVCMLFTVANGRITEISLHGGLMKIMHDIGLQKIA